LNDTNKTKEQLIKEINTLRKQLQQHQNKIDQAGEMVIKSEAYSKRMDSVETLARGIAHNFNNILCGILGYISLIKSKMGAGNEYENICKIEFLAQRASILIKKLLDFVQGKKYLAKPLHCTHIINSNQTFLQKSLNKNITRQFSIFALTPKMPCQTGASSILSLKLK
jgi:C4-dicarboxylate-specific signal transduction histidine kinase